MLCSYYLVADREANCFALSVYALREGAVNVFFINVIWKNWWWNVRWCWSDNFDLMMFYCQPGWSLLRVWVNLQIREGNTVTLLEPFFHNVCVSWQGKTYQYKAIRVDLPQQLLLNGRPTLVQDAVCSTLQAENIAPWKKLSVSFIRCNHQPFC
jgi:hypothetical protein